MPLTSQAANFFSASNLDGAQNASVTIQVPNATTLAEIALTEETVTDNEFHSAATRISRIVSASGVEGFGAQVSVVFRRDVTSITFVLHVTNADAGARWMLHFYT